MFVCSSIAVDAALIQIQDSRCVGYAMVNVQQTEQAPVMCGDRFAYCTGVGSLQCMHRLHVSLSLSLWRRVALCSPQHGAVVAASCFASVCVCWVVLSSEPHTPSHTLGTASVCVRPWDVLKPHIRRHTAFCEHLLQCKCLMHDMSGPLSTPLPIQRRVGAGLSTCCGFVVV